jgi:acetyltransferase
MYMYSYARNLELLQEIPPKLDHALRFDQPGAEAIVRKALSGKGSLLTEVESKALLRCYGIPVNPTEVATTAEEAVRLARFTGYPVVMKVHSPQIVHKSDANGVQLNLRDEKDVEEAFETVTENARAYDPKAELLGVTVQPMLKCSEYELIMGSKRDRDFGPVILFGMGGILTEIVRDRAIAFPPLNRLLARRLMEGTRVYQLLQGYRNRSPVSLEVLEEMLIRLSQLVTDFPEVVELDINPVVLVGKEAVAVDARVLLEPSCIPSPHHLVISPYPNQYEMTMMTKGGVEIFVRPIKPEDAPLLADFFDTLSRETVYYRFFSPLKSLPPRMLALFTQIDYDRDIALVAMATAEKKERILGVSRLMGEPGGRRAEFAVTVADPWQGKGIGAALMERLIQIARERGIESLWGLVLSENTHMLALGKKLGFSISRVPGESQYKLTIELDSPPANS